MFLVPFTSLSMVQSQTPKCISSNITAKATSTKSLISGAKKSQPPKKSQPMQEQSVERLKQTLDEYKTQLEQVQNLFAQNPTNSKLSKLINDLQSAIQLTEDLIELKSRKEEDKARFKEGDYVYGLYEGLWYVAKVTKVVERNLTDDDPKGKDTSEVSANNPETSKRKIIDYYVIYVGYGNCAILNVEKYNIKKYEDPPRQYLTPGSKVLAVYYADELFYEAIIDTVTEHNTCWVTFTGFGNTQEMTFPNIRLLTHTEIYDPKYKPKAKKVSEALTNNNVAVGEKRKDLASQSTDKEPPKKKKKKKGIKKPSKAEQELMKRQENWKAFMSKNKKGLAKREK
jgi:hypothetical protein